MQLKKILLTKIPPKKKKLSELKKKYGNISIHNV